MTRLDDQPQPPQSLDVPYLLSASVPRGERPLGRFLLIGIALAVVAWMLGRAGGAAAPLIGLLALIAGFAGVLWLSARSLAEHRGEQQAVRTVETLMQLRRWQEAAGLLQSILARPMRLETMRAKALVYLSGVLSRYHRFDDAIAVQNHLLEGPMLDGEGIYAVRLGRAMAMLRADHLFDADRAINELRKMVSRAVEAGQESTTGEHRTDVAARVAPSRESAALALVEMYRDVKTGHPDEALQTFDLAREAMRRQLGHRLADGYALGARAAQMIGDAERARRLWADATLLAPAPELLRRYPEIAPVTEFPATPAPSELFPGAAAT